MIDYVIFILTLAAIYAILSMALSLLWGQTGIVNLGLAGFVAVGAYASVLVHQATGGPVVLTILAGAALSGLCGYVLSVVTRSLRDDYLAIITLGFGETIRTIASNERWLTNGTDGISGIPGIFPRGDAAFAMSNLVLMTAAVAILLFLLSRLESSPWGRTLRAVRDDQTAASVAGIPVSTRKTQAFVVGCSVMGLAGAFYAHFTSYISPEIFQPTLTIYVFLAATIGGRVKPTGALIGGYILVFWLEASRFLGEIFHGLAAVQVAAIREIGVGLALLLLMHMASRGRLAALWKRRKM